MGRNRTNLIGARHSRGKLLSALLRFRWPLVGCILLLSILFLTNKSKYKGFDTVKSREQTDLRGNKDNNVVPNDWGLEPYKPTAVEILNEEEIEMDAPMENEITFLEKERVTVSNKGLVVEHNVFRSNTKRFFALEAFFFDGDENRPSYSSVTDDFLIVVLGVGEFTAKPGSQAKAADGQTPKEIPSLVMKLKINGEIEEYEIPAIVHTNGTYFQHKFDRSGNQKFSGERGVWISGVVPKDLATRIAAEIDYGEAIGSVTVTCEHENEKSLSFSLHPFILPQVPVLNFIAPPVSTYDLVHCTAPVHGLSSFRFLIEYILYYKAAKFQYLHLYLYDVDYIEIAKPLLRKFDDFLTIHDWSKVPAHGIASVRLDNFEHGQRLARNDCFFRNRGIAKYISFSDIDELFTANAFDREFISSEYLQNQARLLKEGSDFPKFQILDEDDDNTEGFGSVLKFMEKKYAEDKNNIAFEFTSVTVPPFDVADYDFPQSDSKIVEEFAVTNLQDDSSFNLYFARFCVAERTCTSPYNCGEFHRGRQKYILRVAKGTINPNNPIFYHAISENYDDIAKKLSVQIPSAIGYLRHYAGHFKQSRVGGLRENNRKIMPLDSFILNSIKVAIEEDEDISRYYFKPVDQEEKFLKLYAFHDLNRFRKPSDKQPRESDVGSKDHLNKGRYITFERFPGRLNNQLLTYDWAFRVSKAFNRRLFFKIPTRREFWIGFPQSKLEEDNDSAVWNITLLRKQFDFVMEYDSEYLDDAETKHLLDLEPEKLPSECVWEYGRNSKIITLFMETANENPECTRIHFKTATGLVHPKRSDTRKYGVGPLMFWSAFRPSDYIQSLADTFINDVRKASNGKSIVGIHSRSHNSYNEPEEKALKRCHRLALKPLEAAKTYIQTMNSCCDQPSDLFNKGTAPVPALFNDLDLDAVFDTHMLDTLCKVSSEYLQKFHLDDFEKYQIVLASDHEAKEVDDLLYNDFNAQSFDKNDEIIQGRGVMDETLTPKVLKWRQNIEIVLADMVTVSKADYFHGGPSSTVSQVICYWRLADYQRRGKVEQSNFCHLVLLSTGSYACDAIQCSSVDAGVSALHTLAV